MHQRSTVVNTWNLVSHWPRDEDDFFDSNTVSSCSVSATMDGGENMILLSPINDLLCSQSINQSNRSIDQSINQKIDRSIECTISSLQRTEL